VTLASNGTLSGTSPVEASSTTYSFIVQATDAQLQDTTRSFSLTISTDVVTWSTPAADFAYTLVGNEAMANVSLLATSAAGYGVTYAANTLPTGVSLSGNTVFGTPTTEQTIYTALTATANTTGRTATRYVSWSVVLGDAFWKYNTLLIPGASTTFVDDASTNNFAVTINGDTKPNSFNPYTAGYYSNYFAVNEKLTSASIGTSIGTGDYAIECWAYVPSGAEQFKAMVQLNVSSGFDLYLQISENTLRVLDFNGATTQTNFVLQGGTINNNTWYHLLLTRQSGTVRGFINGRLTVNQASITANYGTATTCIINSGTIVANISNARVVIGNVPAAYQTSSTTNGTQIFTPSTTPLTAVSGTAFLTSQSNRFIDNSAASLALTLTGSPKIQSFDPFVPNSSYSTYGSGYFDGTGDYLSIPSNAALQLPTGDFTIEAWIYLTGALGSYYFIFTQTGATNATSNWDLTVNGNASGQLRFEAFSGGTQIINLIGTSSVPVNAWTHVAVTRSGSTYTIWMNGISQGTASSASTVNTNALTTYIGQNFNNTYYFPGYITDARIVKGTALYTTAFTPPTTPLTAIANTSLLTLQNNQSVNNNTFLDNSTNNLLVTKVGNATQGTFSPYGGNWSNHFNGSSSFINSPTSPGYLAVGTGAITLEAWVFVTKTDAWQGVVSTVPGDTSGNGISIGISNTNKLYAAVGNGGAGLDLVDSVNFTFNTWNYVAVTRAANGTTTLYKNGNSVAAGNSSTSLSANGVIIGRLYTNLDVNYLQGYISNVRISNTIRTITVPTAPYTPDTNTLLLACQSNRVVDNSINNLTIVGYNNTLTQRFSPFNPLSVTPTSYSGYFDGTGDYLSVTNNTVFSFGTGNFTIEFWVYFNSITGYITLMSDGYTQVGGWAIQTGNGTGKFTFYAGSIPTAIVADTGSTVNTGTWYHIAIVRNNSVTTIYRNGTSVGSASDTSNYSYSSGSLIIGGGSATGVDNYFLNGFISNLRIVKGTAVYTSNFTSSTTPLTAIANTSLLTLQSPTFIDNSTNNFTITAFGNSQPTIQNPFGFTSATTNGYTVSTIGGSGYFDGTGDYLSYTGSLSLTGAFTAQGWFYNTTTTGTQRTLFVFNSVSGNGYGSLRADCDQSNTQFNFSVNMSTNGSSWATTLSTNSAYNKNVWNHFAVTRDSSNAVKVFINGVQIASGTQAGTLYNTSTTNAIGCNNLPGVATNPFNGYISDLQLINGTALYTSNFVPPSAPLTAVQNTVLLNNMTSAGIYDAAMMTTMETVGDAKLSTAISKFGGSSMFFDGTGDYLLIPSAQFQNYNFGTGDFTIECWLYQTTFSGDTVWMASYFTWASSVNFYCATRAGTPNVLLFRAGDSVPITLVGNTGITANTWTHVAITRASGVTRMFVGGVLQTNTHTGSVNISATVTSMGIGAANNGTEPLNGYIDDLRVTKGYARYTSNFTPPTSAFQIK
jgi:hypothetical protein